MRNNNILQILGCCVLLSSATANANIINPSFENGLTGWTETDNGHFGTDNGTSIVGVTDGSRAGRVYSSVSGTFSLGDYDSISQSIDLTNVDSVIFDVELYATSSSSWASFLEAVALIDDTVVWSSSTIGSVLNQSINTVSLTGNHNLDLRLRATGSGSGNSKSYWYTFDNFRTSSSGSIPEPGTLALLGFGIAGICYQRRKKVNTG